MNINKTNTLSNGDESEPFGYTLLSVRLIANFMGWIDSPYSNLPNKVYTKDLSEGKMLDQFKYSESWDELMPVCRKIRDLLNSINRPSQNHCCYGDGIEVDIHCALQSIDIIKTLKYVLQFIEWWNESEFSKADR